MSGRSPRVVVTVGRLVLPGGAAEARAFGDALRAALAAPPPDAAPRLIGKVRADARGAGAAEAGALTGAAIAAALAGRR